MLVASRENHRGFIGGWITWIVEKLMGDHKMDAIWKTHPNIPSVPRCDGGKIEQAPISIRQLFLHTFPDTRT